MTNLDMGSVKDLVVARMVDNWLTPELVFAATPSSIQLDTTLLLVKKTGAYSADLPIEFAGPFASKGSFEIQEQIVRLTLHDVPSEWQGNLFLIVGTTVQRLRETGEDENIYQFDLPGELPETPEELFARDDRWLLVATQSPLD